MAATRHLPVTQLDYHPKFGNDEYERHDPHDRPPGLLHARFDGPIVMIGFGSIGRGTLPLIERHIGFDRSKFVVIAPDDGDRDLLDERKLTFITCGDHQGQLPRRADPAAHRRGPGAA